MQKNTWNKENVVSTIEQFIKIYGRLPVATEMNPKNGLPTRRTFECKMGMTFFEYGKENHPDLIKLGKLRQRQHIAKYRMQREWTQDMVVSAIGQFVQRHHRLPFPQEYTSDNDLPSYKTFCRIAVTSFNVNLEMVFCQPTEQDHEAKDLQTSRSASLLTLT